MQDKEEYTHDQLGQTRGDIDDLIFCISAEPFHSER